MHLSMVHLIGVMTLYLLGLAQAKAVFAHYMVLLTWRRLSQFNH